MSEPREPRDLLKVVYLGDGLPLEVIRSSTRGWANLEFLCAVNVVLMTLAGEVPEVGIYTEPLINALDSVIERVACELRAVRKAGTKP